MVIPPVRRNDMRILRAKSRTNKRTAARVGRQKRPSKQAPKPEPKAAETTQPVDIKVPVLPWMDFDGSPNTAVPLTTLVAAMFDGHDTTEAPGTNTPAGFLSKVLRSIADDLELLNRDSERDALDHAPAIGRSLSRIESRARQSVEIARRMVKSEVLT
jgi:hypothetical protein